MRGDAVPTVLVLGPSGDDTAARALASDLSSIEWPGWAERPQVRATTVAATRAEGHGPPLAYVVACNASDESRTLEACRERAAIESVPLVVVGGPAHAPSGDLRFAADTPPLVLAAALGGLLARQPEVERLGRELSLTGRVADGVQSELTRIDEELQMAALLQQEFLPAAPPLIEGIEFRALWRPAGSVSGDVYDFIRLDESHVGVFLADAVGHGMPAALMAMQLCRALEVRDNHDRVRRVVPVGEALARLNALMVDRQGRVGRYASAVYATIDCRERVMRVACAGGPPPALVAPNGDIRIVPAHGPLLGLSPVAEFDEAMLELEDDEIVLFHSDGLEQAFRDDGELFAPPSIVPRHLDEIARMRRHQSCDAALADLARRLDGEEGSLHPSDDCTVVMVRATRRAAARAA